MFIIGYLVMIFLSSFLLSLGWILFTDEDENWVPILSAVFWPIGFPLCGGYLVAMWMIDKYT